MKNKILFALMLFCGLLFFCNTADAQCSICTRTAQQLGDKPARNLNAGILYLAFTPLAIIGVIAYRWFKKEEA